MNSEDFLGIPNLKWLPFIGKNYSIAKYKLLIVGESHYAWEVEEEAPENRMNEAYQYLNSASFTHDFITRDGVNRIGNNKNKINSFITNIEKAIFNKIPIDNKKVLWESSSYYNIIPIYMENLKIRPTHEQFSEGWKILLEVIAILKPDFVLFGGVEASNHAPTDKDTLSIMRLGEKTGNTFPRNGNLIIDEKSHKLLFIKHPSQHFPWSKWGALIDTEMIDYKNWLNENLAGK